nr:signal peptidase I [Mobiluncus porci]
MSEATGEIPARKSRKSAKEKNQSPWWKDVIIGVLITIVLTTFVKAFMFQQFKIPSESMENTLQRGDQIVVSEMKNFQPVRRGDIVVFEDRYDWLPVEYKDDNPTGFDATAVGQAVDKGLRFLRIRPEYAGGYLVKRVIGVGGDEVSCCNEKNQVVVNGVALNEPYLKDGLDSMPFPFDVTVPQGKYWVMGDNRDNSGDSRYHQDDLNQGFVDENQVVGRALLRYFPLARWQTFHNPGLDKLPEASSKPNPPKAGSSK